jgi:hypothetical protein
VCAAFFVHLLTSGGLLLLLGPLCLSPCPVLCNTVEHKAQYVSLSAGWLTVEQQHQNASVELPVKNAHMHAAIVLIKNNSIPDSCSLCFCCQTVYTLDSPAFSGHSDSCWPCRSHSQTLNFSDLRLTSTNVSDLKDKREMGPAIWSTVLYSDTLFALRPQARRTAQWIKCFPNHNNNHTNWQLHDPILHNITARSHFVCNEQTN